MENQMMKEAWLRIAGLGRDCGDFLTVGRFNVLLVIVAMLTMLCPGLVTSAIAICGMPDDGLAHTPPEYTSMVPPPKGQTYMDPAYGCIVKRITDGPIDFATAAHHEYSIMSPFNQDNTLILTWLGYGLFYVASTADGSIVVTPEALDINTQWEPRWSRTDPNVFYYHGGCTPSCDERPNELWKLHINRSTNPPTITKTRLRTFAEYPTIGFCGGTSDLSEDGNRIAICDGAGTTVFVYKIDTDRMYNPLLTAVCDAHVTPNNNVIVEQCGNGWHLYSIDEATGDMIYIRPIISLNGVHMDVGRDTNGEEIMVVEALTDSLRPPTCDPNGIEKIRLSDSTRTCLLKLYKPISVHPSIANGWLLVSNTDESDWTPDTSDDQRGTANPPPTLPPLWASEWGTYFNELTLVRLDFSINTKRLAHHRSRRWDGYWHQPRAALSMDGQFLAFDSNFAIGAPPLDYTDVYLIDLR